MSLGGKICMAEKKRDQHYVFQAYLKKWANVGNGKIWCLREGEIFDVKPRNIAFEKDFYRIKSLNEKEVDFIKLFFNKYSDSFKEGVEKFLDLYTMFDRYELAFKQLRGFLPEECNEADEALQEVFSDIDIAKNNTLEDVYASFEGESICWFERLIDGNVDFFYNATEEKEKFINFVCMQYYRTLTMKNNSLAVLKEAERIFVNNEFPKGCLHAESLVIPILWIISARCADAIMKFPLTLLLNKTDTPFITSDQPVINTEANYKDLLQEPSDLIFYYPISPFVAIVLNDRRVEKKIELNESKEIERYNDMIAEASNKMIFSNDADTLKRYIKK